MSAPVQLVLFGPVPVHIGRRSAVTGRRICADCKGDLAITGTWDRWDGCHGSGALSEGEL